MTNTQSLQMLSEDIKLACVQPVLYSLQAKLQAPRLIPCLSSPEEKKVRENFFDKLFLDTIAQARYVKR